MMILILVAFIVLIFVVSEKFGVTFAGAINICAKLIYALIKQLLTPPKTYLPTAIGFADGTFYPGEVEKVYDGLSELFDGLYLVDYSTHDDDIINYQFKFARVKNDLKDLDLYDYADKRALALLQQHIHKHYNIRLSGNISSLTLDKNGLVLHVARTAKGEQMNYNWRIHQRQLLHEKSNKIKKEPGPIEIAWDKQ